jgi:hypothetical protein
MPESITEVITEILVGNCSINTVNQALVFPTSTDR